MCGTRIKGILIAQDSVLYEEHKDKRAGRITTDCFQVRNTTKRGTGAQVGAYIGDWSSIKLTG